MIAKIMVLKTAHMLGLILERTQSSRSRRTYFLSLSITFSVISGKFFNLNVTLVKSLI